MIKIVLVLQVFPKIIHLRQVMFSCNFPGSLGISVVRQETGGVGRAASRPGQHPHLFPYFTEIPKEPIFRKAKDQDSERGVYLDFQPPQNI